MSEYLTLNATECSHCYKCIRNCPVKAISFSNNQATIIEQECILCGRCFVACPKQAKSICISRGEVEKLIKTGKKVIVSLAPSYISNFTQTGIQGMRIALKKLGFYDVQETAIGAAAVKRRYDEMVNNEEKNVVISSCCSSVNMLIQKHFPAALPFTASLVSPMLAHGMIIKKEEPDALVVFIGPCISKKSEAKEYGGIIDAVLTFDELQQWLDEEKIVPERLSQPHSGIRTGLFPIAGGVLRTMEKSNPNYSYMSIDGVEDCMSALQDIINGDISKCFIEMSACRGSCIGGPVMDGKHGLVHNYAAVDINVGATLAKDDSLTGDELKKNITFQSMAKHKYSKTAVDDVLSQIGKTSCDDELNCGYCGYDTCRKKGEAVLEGKADLNMCLPYLMSRAKSFSDTIINNTPNGIIVVDNKLSIQQINTSAVRLFKLRNAADVVGQNVICLIDPAEFMHVLDDKQSQKEKKMYLAEYNKYIMLSILYDQDLAIGIIRDVTNFEYDRQKKQRLNEQTIAVTDKVIEKQMKTVQEIASLLGETAAETKIALTKLKETLHDN